MSDDRDPFAGWTPEQIALGRRWVATWKRAGEALERIRIQELRQLDTYRAIAALLSPSLPAVPPRPSSGLVEQQRWFMRARRHS